MSQNVEIASARNVREKDTRCERFEKRKQGHLT